MAKTYRLAARPIDHDDPTFYYDVDPDLLRSGEAAELAGVTMPAFQYYLKRRLIEPCGLVGRRLRLFHRQAVLALRDQRNREKSPHGIWRPGHPYKGPYQARSLRANGRWCEPEAKH
jgi:hypothetical protein